eukprot:241153-Pleurochrysis_carterae.AAC.1
MQKLSAGYKKWATTAACKSYQLAAKVYQLAAKLTSSSTQKLSAGCQRDQQQHAKVISWLPK